MEINFENLAKQVGSALLSKNLKLVTAESCTGGWISTVITFIPESSHWFERGFITYSSKSKEELLNVDKKIITEYGVVSAQTAEFMALGALKNSHADISLAITGIAGPGGGCIKNPIGTVYVAFLYKNHSKIIHKLFLNDERNIIRANAVKFALQELIKFIANV